MSIASQQLMGCFKVTQTATVAMRSCLPYDGLGEAQRYDSDQVLGVKLQHVSAATGAATKPGFARRLTMGK
jgi:hypothetical protein